MEDNVDYAEPIDDQFTEESIEEKPSVLEAVYKSSIIGNVLNPSPRVSDAINLFKPEKVRVDRDAALSYIPEEDHEHYSWCESQEDFDAETKELMERRQYAEVIEEHPWKALASSVAVGLGETIALSLVTGGAGTAASTAGASKIAVSAIKQIATAGAKGAAIAGAYGATDASVNYINNDLYTKDDAIYTGIASTILGAALGAGGGAISVANQTKYIQNLKNKIATGFQESWFKVKGDKLIAENIIEETVNSAGNKLEFTYNDMHPFVQKVISNNPITQGLGSESEVLQLFTDTTYRHNFLLKARAKGEYVGSVAAESGKEVRDAVFHDLLDNFQQTAKDFVKSNPYYSTQEFSLFVTRNIKGTQGSKDPNIIKASEMYQNWLNNEIDSAVKHKFFDIDPRIAKENPSDLNYFTTVYDREVISKNQTEFESLVRRKILGENSSYTEDKVTEIYHSIYNNIMGDNLGKYSLPFESKEGNVKITKERKFLINRSDFEDFEKFLVNDPIEVGHVLNRDLSTGIEMARVASELFSNTPELEGKTVIGKWIYRLEKERDGKLNICKSDIEKEKIRNLYKGYTELISDGELLIKGMYDAPTGLGSLKTAKALSAIRSFNYIRLLGGVGLTSLIDFKNIINRNGFGKSFHSLIHGFNKNSAFNLNKSDLKKFGAASEYAWLDINNRYNAHNDLNAYRGSQYGRKASNFFSKATLMPQINDFNKRIAATLHGTDIIEACLSDNTLSLKDTQFLAQARIPFSHRKEIAKRFKESGKFDENGLAVFNMGSWADDKITRTFAASLSTCANQTIVIPSRGDVPRIMKSNWGKTLTQFMGYQFGIMNNVIAPWFNGQNSHAAASLATGVGIAYGIEYIKALLSADSYEHLDDPDLIWNSLEKSDALGHFGTAFNAAKNVFNPRQTFGSALERMSPAISFASDVTSAIKSSIIKPILKEDYVKSEKELRTIKGLVPFNNLIYINGFLNDVIRRRAENSGGKLRKTREDRYYGVKE